MVRDYIKQLRVYQWTKSGFVVMPFVFSDYLPVVVSNPFSAGALELLFKLAAAFFAFSTLASSVYVFNDYRDRHQDALDSRKKHRPIASGRIGPAGAIAAIVILVGTSATLASFLPITFRIILSIIS